jgi:tRNA A-37 threonylcarbamoyl transferase component Bud32
VYRNRRRLRRAWENHLTLEYMELAVAPRVFCVRKPSFGKNGFIAMEDLGQKGEDLSRFLDGNYMKLALSGEMEHFVERFSSFLLLLFKREITHKDLKTSNIFVLRDGSFRLLDIEDTQFEGLRGDSLRDALVQLNKSVPKMVRIGYRLRFLSRVAKGLSLSRPERKALLRSVREESLRDEIVYVGASGTTMRETWT